MNNQDDPFFVRTRRECTRAPNPHTPNECPAPDKCPNRPERETLKFYRPGALNED